jgi:hypothetical protein
LFAQTANYSADRDVPNHVPNRKLKRKLLSLPKSLLEFCANEPGLFSPFERQVKVIPAHFAAPKAFWFVKRINTGW